MTTRGKGRAVVWVMWGGAGLSDVAVRAVKEKQVKNDPQQTARKTEEKQ